MRNEGQRKYYLSYPKPPVLDTKRECCSMGKHSNVSSSTKWRLGENVAQRLMECLTSNVSFDVFMDNYFTSFRLLTILVVSKIQATPELNKNKLRKYTITGDKQLQRKETLPL